MTFDEIKLKARLNMLSHREEFIAVPSPTVKWQQEREKWIYRPEKFNPNLRLRTVLAGEIVVEYDAIDRKVALRNIEKTEEKLKQAGYSYEVFDHGGVSPHIHLFFPDLVDLPEKQRMEYKKLFLDKYAEDSQHTDKSLCGIHLLALEFAPHWKTKYDGAVKERLRINDTFKRNKLNSKLLKEVESIREAQKFNSAPSFATEYTKRIEEVFDITPYTKGSNGEYFGSHPVHGSSTGQNFWINTEKQMWHCFRHNTGGSIIELVAMLEGAIKCEDCTRGVE